MNEKYWLQKRSVLVMMIFAVENQIFTLNDCKVGSINEYENKRIKEN